MHPSHPRIAATAFPAEEIRPIDIVVVYTDRQAYRHVMQVLGASFTDIVNPADVCLLPWHIGEVMGDSWHERAVSDAAAADLLIIATSPNARLSSRELEWMVDVAVRRTGRAMNMLMVDSAEAAEPPFESSGADYVRALMGAPTLPRRDPNPPHSPGPGRRF